MPSGFYTNYVEALHGGGAHGQVDYYNDLIKVAIVSGSDYSENLGTDADYNDTGYAKNICYNGDDTETLGSKTVGTIAARALDAANSSFASVSTDGNNVDALLIYYDSTDILTSTLIMFMDGFSEVIPNGSDINITWNSAGLGAL